MKNHRQRDAGRFLILLTCFFCSCGESGEEGPVSKSQGYGELCPDSAAQAGQCAVYEAEEYATASGCKNATNHQGFTGTGFVDFGRNNTWFKLEKIQAPVDGVYTLTVGYANGGCCNRPLSVIVDDDVTVPLDFPATGRWRNWRTATTTVPLSQGNHWIKILAVTDSGGPNVDHLVLLPPEHCPDGSEPSSCGCGVPEEECTGQPGGAPIITASGENMPDEGMVKAFDESATGCSRHRMTAPSGRSWTAAAMRPSRRENNRLPSPSTMTSPTESTAWRSPPT